MSLVRLCPELLRIWVEVTHAFGSCGPSACRLNAPPEDMRPIPIGVSVNEVIRCLGARKWGRTHKVKPTRTATNANSVVAIAGTVRRTSTPTVRPSANANAAYAMGTIPRSLKMSGRKRLAATVSSGLDHQVTIRLNNPAATMLANPTTPTLTASQRVRVTLWVHARRNVPASSSRATSGAPQKTPMRAGTSSTTRLRCCRKRCLLLRTPVTTSQSPREAHVATVVE